VVQRVEERLVEGLDGDRAAALRSALDHCVRNLEQRR
jgi:hypothetical protein